MTQTPPGPLKLIHIITSLDTGGAEMMLFRLVAQMDRARFENRVISLIPMGPMGVKIQALGIEVESLGMKPGRFSFRAFFWLVSLLHRERPALIQTWMYHADLMGNLAAWVVGGIPVVWGIHNSTLDPQSSRLNTRAVVWLLARLSCWLPKRIISCSLRARDVHVGIGYYPDKMIVIPNGFDTVMFRQDEQARRDIRVELAIAQDVPLIGMVARYDPQKDFRNFVEAARIISGKNGSVRFLLCGKGADWNNIELVGWLQENGLNGRFTLVGQRDDIPRIMNGLDILSLSSAFGEAFPLTVGEAMACGIPCVATDVGDTAYMIGDTGIVVPPKDPQALADGWERLLRMNPAERRKLGEQARQRIQDDFDLGRIVKQYEQLYERVTFTYLQKEKSR
jgi:glycosyltransferase involved in cell wall biosynthesis